MKYTWNSAYDNNHPSQLMTTLTARSVLMDGSITTPNWKVCIKWHTSELLPLKKALSMLTIFGVIFYTLHELGNAFPTVDHNGIIGE